MKPLIGIRSTISWQGVNPGHRRTGMILNHPMVPLTRNPSGIKKVKVKLVAQPVNINAGESI
jgi:hypothetical protein